MTRQDKLELLEVRSLQKRTNYNKNQSKKERTIIKCQQVEGQGLGDLNIYIYTRFHSRPSTFNLMVGET